MKQDIGATGNAPNYFHVACGTPFYTSHNDMTHTMQHCVCLSLTTDDSANAGDRRRWPDPDDDPPNQARPVRSPPNMPAGVSPLTLLASAPFLLPTLKVVSHVLTFSQSRVTKLWHMYLLHALVGLFEVPSFGGPNSNVNPLKPFPLSVELSGSFAVGSWCRKEELFKREGVWSWAIPSAQCSRATSRSRHTRTSPASAVSRVGDGSS